jgi:hypothetical protein
VLRIHWEPSHASRKFAVQVKSSEDAPWKDVARHTDNRRAVCSIDLPRHAYRFIRVYQDADGGSEDRPGLMWVAQVKWLP